MLYQSRADAWFGSGEAFYSLEANCSNYRFTTISSNVEHWCSDTALCVGFSLPFCFVVIVKKTYALNHFKKWLLKQNHSIIDSKSTEI